MVGLILAALALSAAMSRRRRGDPVLWVAIGQARMGLAARDAGTSYLVLGGLLVSRLLAGRHCM